MALASLSDADFKTLLSENFTPSATIKTPERLFGRAKALTTIERAFASAGRQVFIYGDRGVGKTSLAETAAHLHQDSRSTPIYVPCANSGSFAEVMTAVGNATISITKRVERRGATGTYGATVFGTGLTIKPAEADLHHTLPDAQTLTGALDIIRYVLEKRPGPQIIIIDEMERIGAAAEREKFAEFIKNIPQLEERVKFIFCGIGTTVDELIGAHPSAGRILETISLEKLHHNYLWEIIRHVANQANVEIPTEMLVRIGQISDGFPHYVHLIGESMFWSAYDDKEEVTKLLSEHFRAGITGALERAEGVLRQQYQKATRKTKNTTDYEEALWAVADTTSDSRQLSEIYEASYKRIMMRRQRVERLMLTKELFNQRLLALKKEGHGSILKGYGSGWFGFRENIIRGYVRLMAEQAGVELGRDIR
ncbi:ATP-binding protein [Rhizobium sp. MHM7A]|uniref:ATP-binding protein n=1 Tax=Rhizobium sp. MHM7A TaxID=2583233 RepID=UPI001106943B|nr:ATP-binding protein [Rhizobium sp. MHM7A]TLX11760.1 AAA family ATPase [Rhizobium sp. MHM7A]